MLAFSCQVCVVFVMANSHVADTFLISAFRSMALNLQERANIVFQKEKENNRQQSYHSSITRRTPISSQDPFFRRKSNTALRSLVDLLGIKVKTNNLFPVYMYSYNI